MSLFPFLSSLVVRVPDMAPMHIGIMSSLPRLSTMGTFLPYTMDGPFKTSMNFLIRLAWTTRLQIPVLIAVAFMAFDIRLQLEINIFWEGNQRQINNQIVNNDMPEIEDGGVNGYVLDQLLDADSLLHSDGDESSTEYTSDEDEEEEDEDDDDDDISVESQDDSKIHSDINSDLNSTLNNSTTSDNSILSVSEILNLNHQSSDDNANNDCSSSEIKIKL